MGGPRAGSEAGFVDSGNWVAGGGGDEDLRVGDLVMTPDAQYRVVEALAPAGVWCGRQGGNVVVNPVTGYVHRYEMEFYRFQNVSLVGRGMGGSVDRGDR